MLLDPKMTRLYAMASGAAISKAVLLALGYWIGSKLDKRFGTSPLFMFLCVCVALAIGIWGVVRVLDRMNKEDKR
jgi:F0F1-type ATP synthase assembly protein I